jgi:broad specificity phosphatase PhoE
MSQHSTPTLSPGLEASLAQTARRRRRVLLIRHSDRPKSLPGVDDMNLELTAEGEARAIHLGERLGESLRWARSSPLRRCMLTAELAGLSAELSALLGAPGPFVVDREVGRKVFREHGTEAVVRAHILGETWGCMRPLEDGARSVIRDLRTRLAALPSTGLAVSHDAIVMPIIAWITGETFAERWLDPLDGAILTPDEFFWEGRAYEVPR